jgi:hypothetical protein
MDSFLYTQMNAPGPRPLVFPVVQLLQSMFEALHAYAQVLNITIMLTPTRQLVATAPSSGILTIPKSKLLPLHPIFECPLLPCTPFRPTRLDLLSFLLLHLLRGLAAHPDKESGAIELLR